MSVPLRCWLPDCQSDVLVQWRRRSGDGVEAVAACSGHAITLDAAAHVHQAMCAPDLKALPTCGCAPEPIPVTDDPLAGASTVTLSTGWTVPAGP